LWASTGLSWPVGLDISTVIELNFDHLEFS
jgi:hypothetical protein